jgi:TolA-binding protein
MNKRHLIPPPARAWLAALVAAAVFSGPAARAQQGAPEAAAAAAFDLFNAGQTTDAIAAYEKVLKDYPTSAVVSDAQFRLGYLYFQNGDFEKSIAQLKKILQPPATPDVQELAYALLPQVIAARASKLRAGDSRRDAGFQDAIKQFDVFIQKYPAGEEMETVVYGRALCSYQVGKYDDAIAGLRSNLQKFANSESVLDSQYLLSIALATQAATVLQTTPGDQQAFSKYDEAEKLLRDIIQRRTDLALANDAQFQLGEVLMSRAAFSDKLLQPTIYAEAMEALRAVDAKEPIVQAQTDRIEGVRQRIREAGAARNLVAIRRLQRLLESEQGKLAALKTKGDQTITAKIKIGQLYYMRQRNDEARLMLNHLLQFAEDDAQKKTILYFVTLTYAAQNNVEKAVAGYNDFNAKYKGDPIADNLPLAIGAMFLSADPKVNDPEKAIQYFKEEVALYPNGRFTAEAYTQQAAALVQLKRFDEALASFKSLLATNPAKDIAAAAEFGIATIDSQTGKLDDALAEFKTVRDKYPGTPQAEQAAYFTGQTLVQKGENKTGIAELTAFLAKFPSSKMAPSAMFYLGNALAASGNKPAAIAKYKELAEKYPQSEAAPFGYFQRASIYGGEQKTDEMVATMREFIAKYPQSDKIFFAYDSIAQAQANAGQLPQAAATYLELVEKNPQNPMAPEAQLKAADLFHRYAETQGLYVVLNDQERTEWTKGVSDSIAAVEQLLEKFPGSAQVALGLQTLLADQRLLVNAKIKTDAELEKYFQDLAEKVAANPAAKSKVLFTLASHLYGKDKAKALQQMTAAYDPALVYAPADIDLYGTALIEQGKTDDARKIYEKLSADFPNPPNVAPDKAPPQIAEAQSIVVYGLGKCLQKEGKVAEAGKKFDDLKKFYPWSPKILEASFGIAQSLFEQQKYDDAIALLIPIMRAQSASATVELRANAMLLGGEIQEAKKDLPAARDYYLKIAAFYEGVPDVAAEGLWKGGQVIEQIAASIPDAAKKSAAIAKAAKAYKNLTDKYPASPFAEKAKARLAALPPVK